MHGDTKLAYSEFLQSLPWDLFFTATFRSPRKEPYYAINHVSNTLRTCNAARQFIACEPHSSGDLHLHGLLANSRISGHAELLSPHEIWGTLFKKYGRAKVEFCNNQAAVANYCAKYVVKETNKWDHYEFVGHPWHWLIDKWDII